MSNPIQKVALIGLSCLLSAMAEAAQTCHPASIPATTPTSQFTDNRNGTVTDKLTGLMWKKCSEGQAWDSNTNGCTGREASYTWQDALKQAQTVNTSGGFAGFTDWRLPNITELESLVEEQCYDPAINLSVFPNTPSNYFWSSSPVAYYGYYAWVVYFSYGYDDWYYKYYNGSVRLVRSGQ